MDVSGFGASVGCRILEGFYSIDIHGIWGGLLTVLAADFECQSK